MYDDASSSCHLSWQWLIALDNPSIQPISVCEVMTCIVTKAALLLLLLLLLLVVIMYRTQK